MITHIGKIRQVDIFFDNHTCNNTVILGNKAKPSLRVFKIKNNSVEESENKNPIKLNDCDFMMGDFSTFDVYQKIYDKCFQNEKN